MSIDPKFVELTAGVVRLFQYKNQILGGYIVSSVQNDYGPKIALDKIQGTHVSYKEQKCATGSIAEACKDEHH